MLDCSISGGDFEDVFMFWDFFYFCYVCVVFLFYFFLCVFNSFYCNKVRLIVIFIIFNLFWICRVKVFFVLVREFVKLLCCLGRGLFEGFCFILILKIFFLDFWYVCCYVVLVLFMWSCGIMFIMGYWIG